MICILLNVFNMAKRLADKIMTQSKPVQTEHGDFDEEGRIPALLNTILPGKQASKHAKKKKKKREMN